MSVAIPGYERFTYRAAGGFSQVYEAYQTAFSRKVAVKVLTVAGNQPYSPEAFKLECRAMGVVSAHPNIVTVLDSGFTVEGQPYIAMELYQESLLDRIRTSRFLPLEDVLQLGVLMASALHAAHEASILHRDIKPQNIFFSRYGDPALGDFGIASLAHDQRTDTVGALTEHYAAPEVLDGAAPTRSSDVYSLGATLYSALAGRQPFAPPGAREPREVLYQRIISDPVPAIIVQQIPEREQHLLFTLLAKHPHDRPRTALAAGELLQDIQRQLRLDVTPLRQAAFELRDDTTRARIGVEVGERSPSPGPVQLRSGGGPAEARSAEPEDATGDTLHRAALDDSPRPAAGFRIEARAARGAGLLVAATVIVGLGWMLVGRGRPEQTGPAVTLPTSSSTLTVVEAGPPSQPANLASSASASVVTITWDQVPGAERYRVEFVVGGGDPVLVNAPMVDIDLSGRTQACVTVAAVNSRGQVSPPTEPYCLGEPG